MQVTILEPNPEQLEGEVLRLLLHLCARAEEEDADDLFHLAAPTKVVEAVVRLGAAALHETGAKWGKRERVVRTKSDLRVSTGPNALAGADYDEAVVVCAGNYPNRETMDRVESIIVRPESRVTFVFDPNNPPKAAVQLRDLQRRTRTRPPNLRVIDGGEE